MRIHSLLRFLGTREKEISNSIRRISSGFKINNPSDDPANLSISSKLSLQIRKNMVSIDNINNGISIIRTAEDALTRINGILNRVRTLVLKMSNDILTDLDREKYVYEIGQLLFQIDDIAHSTKYNGKSLLQGALEKSLDILEGGKYLEDIKLNDVRSGLYDISVISGGKEKRITLPFKTLGEISLSTSLYTALGESSLLSYYKTLNISDGISNVDVVFDVNPSGGDTVGSMIERLNDAFISRGINIIASFDSTGKCIILSSTEPGTKYNVDVKELNSIDGAINFSDVIAVSALEGANGPFFYKQLMSITGAISGPSVGGGTLIKDYFKTSSPLTFQFKGFGGYTLALNIPISYTLDYTATYIKNQLRANWGIDVNVKFDEKLTDTFQFLYSNLDQRLELSIIGGVHQEGYLSIEATPNTLLGNILDLQDELSLTFLDQYGPLATLNFTRNSSIQDVIDGINSSGINISASYEGGIIKLDQSSRVSKVIGISQTGTDSFLIEKKVYPGVYPILDQPEDIIISINEHIYSSSSREFNTSGFNFVLTKEALESLARIEFIVRSHPLTLLIGEEKVDIYLPDVSLHSIGLDYYLDLYDSSSVLGKIDEAMERVNSETVKLGTYENTFKSLIQSLGCYSLSLQEANDRLTDVDIAREISNLVRNKILYEAGVDVFKSIKDLSPKEILSLIQ
jgi:flagellin